jgi:hypothetical protein
MNEEVFFGIISKIGIIWGYMIIILLAILVFVLPIVFMLENIFAGIIMAIVLDGSVLGGIIWYIIKNWRKK